VTSDRRFLLAALAAVALPALLFAIVAWQGHGRALEEAHARLERTARIGQEHAARVIETNIVIGREIDALVATRDPARLVDDETMLHARLARMTEGLVQLQSVWIWGADGRPIASNRFNPCRAPSTSRTASISSPRAEQGLVHQPPARGAPDRRGVHRRHPPWTDSRDEFRGVISVSLLSKHFTEFYATLARAEPGLSMSLIRADGAILARWPELAAGAVVTLPPESPLKSRIAAGERQGTLVGRSSVDGTLRLGAFQTLDRLPLVVFAGIDRDVALADWRRSTLLLGAFTFPISFGLAYMMFGAWRRARGERLMQQRLSSEERRRIRAERALIQSQKLEAIGQLTGGVAHDFNNLLMVIGTNAHLVRKLAGDSAQAQVSAIERAVAAGSSLTRQLLAFSRRQALRPEIVRLDRKIPELIELVRASTGRTIEVESRLGDALPAVKVDAAELELALINLALNARDAMPDGGRLSIEAEPVALPDDGRAAVEIRVSDTGTGIPPELHVKVFEPFFSTKPPGQGTGLGLSQVFGFAGQAGGSVRLDSEPGRGTTFTLVLPAATDADLANAAAPEAGSSQVLAGHVLVVEDNPEVAQALRQVIEGFGCTVTHATSAVAAQRMLAQEAGRFDAVLTDIQMPGPMSGVELALEIRTRTPELPVALITGYAAELQRAVAAGLKVVAKPTTPDVLAATLGDLFARRHADRDWSRPEPSPGHREAADPVAGTRE
jgi:two-component system NtrC family sensor kinase